MRLARIAFLFILAAGCAAVDREVPVAPASAELSPSATPKPGSAPSPPSASSRATETPPAAPAVRTPTPVAPTAAATEKRSASRATETPVATRPPVPAGSSGTAARPVPPPATAPAALDVNALKEQLKETKSIGVLTKLTLKNQVDDLLQQFRDFHQGRAKVTMAQLRRSYDLLLMKVLSLVQDADRPLASAIVASREAIWGLLADPKKFSTLEG